MRHRQGQAQAEGRTNNRGGEDAWLWAPPGRSRLVKSMGRRGRRGKARKKEDRWRRGKGRKGKKIEMGESAREEAEWRRNRKKQREAGGGAGRRKVEREEPTETQPRKSGEEGERRQERSDLGSFPKDWRLGSRHLLIVIPRRRNKREPGESWGTAWGPPVVRGAVGAIVLQDGNKTALFWFPR